MWNRVTRQGPLWFLYDSRARIRPSDYRTDITLVVFATAVVAMIGFMVVQATL